MTSRLCVAAVLMLLVSGVPVVASDDGGAEPQALAVNPDAATVADFMQRVADYAKLHKKLDDTLQAVPRDSNPVEFLDHQRALAGLIQKERGSAKPGDICPQAMRTLMRRVLAGVFRGPNGRQIKHSILDEYTGHVRLEINGQYPERVPFASVPPEILQALPKLPDLLEYRFIGERLILLDVEAHVIVDFIEHVFP
jgi:hypothetical protein